MKRILMVFAALTMIWLGACKDNAYKAGNATDTFKNIPTTSSAVGTINLKSLFEKADFEEIKKMDFYQEVLNKAQKEDALAAAILENPAVSGIDLGQNAYTFIDFEPKSKSVLGGITFSIADKSAFETMVKKANKEDVVTHDGFSAIITKTKESTVVAWNDNMAFMGVVSNNNNVREAISKVFNPASDATPHSKLTAFANENHDMGLWLNSNTIAENINDIELPTGGFGLPPAMIMMTLGITTEDLKDNFIQITNDFEKGQMVTKTAIDIKKNIRRDFDALLKDKPSTDFSPYFPKKDLGSIAAMAFNMDGINVIAEDRKFIGNMVEAQLGDMGLDLKTLTGALGGDITYATYGDASNPTLLVGADVKNKATVTKLFSLAGDMIKKQGNRYVIDAPNMGGQEVALIFKDDKLFVSNNMDFLTQIEKGGFAAGERVDSKMMSNITNNIMGSYMNFSALTDQFGMASDELESMYSTADRSTSTTVTKMKSKDVNSLKLFFQMINQEYLKEKRKEGSEI